MKNLILAVLLFLGFTLSAQERLGLRMDNYMGINQAALNPAFTTTLPFSWDVNIIEVGVFADNNFGYLENTNLIKLAKGEEDIVSALDFSDEAQIPPSSAVANFNRNKRNYYGQADIRVTGPSFVVNLDGKHSFGVITAFRTSGGSRKIPNVLGYYEFDAQELDNEFLVKPFKTAAAAWGEIGLHYGYRSETLESYTDNHWAIGATVKYLAGFEGAYFNSLRETGLTKITDNQLQFVTGDAEFGLTTDYVYTEEFDRLRVNGGGLGMDIGFMYTISDDADEGYKLKLGVSLIDLGYIRFRDNAEVHRLDDINPYTINLDQYESITTYEAFIDQASTDVLGDPDASLQGTSFALALPTALSFQADYALTKNFYASAVWVQHVPLGNRRLARTDLIALTPRFEHRWFGLGIPVSVLNYDQVNAGLYLRLAYLTIGTDNLGSFVGNNKVSGTDVYVALKFNPFAIKTKDKKFKRTSYGRKKVRGKPQKCYF